MLEFSIHISVYIAVVTGIINTVFCNEKLFQQIAEKFRKIDKFLKSSAEISKKDLAHLKVEAVAIFVFVVSQYGFTTAVQYEYLNVHVIMSYISYNLNLSLFLVMCLTLHTFVLLLRRRMEALNFQLRKYMDEGFNVSVIDGSIICLNSSSRDVCAYAGCYKTVFEIVGLLNAVYGIQMMVLTFLNLMAIIYNMYVSTMKKTQINSYPEMYLLMIHMLHSLIYLVSEKLFFSTFAC